MKLIYVSFSQDPHKSSIVFCALVLLWLFLALVPLRMLILLGGLVSPGTCFPVVSKQPPLCKLTDLTLLFLGAVRVDISGSILSGLFVSRVRYQSE